MSLARNLARLFPNASGLLPNANIEAMAASKLTGQVPDANAPSGSVIQVVQAIATAFTGVSTVTETAISQMIATITPSSSSNKILVLVTLGEFRSPTTVGARFQLYKNGSKLLDAANEVGYGLNVTQSIGMAMHWSYLDSPATTSATSYQLYGRKLINNAGTLEIMPNGASTSSIILMEIAA